MLFRFWTFVQASDSVLFRITFWLRYAICNRFEYCTDAYTVTVYLKKKNKILIFNVGLCEEPAAPTLSFPKSQVSNVLCILCFNLMIVKVVSVISLVLIFTITSFACCRWKLRSNTILAVLKNLGADFFCLQVFFVSSCQTIVNVFVFVLEAY